MDYSALTPTIFNKVMDAIALINNPEITPEVRQLNLEILFREVGTAIYGKVFDMNTFDFDTQHITGPGINDSYYGLAKVVSNSISNGSLGIEEYVKNYLDNAGSKAQEDAFRLARQSGSHPTVDRQLVGSKNCKWCISKAGHYVEPDPEVFHRHGGCDCRIITAGYNSRNGLLENYKPRKSS
jgi:hypothetical protein